MEVPHCFLLVLLCALLPAVVNAQDSQSGFISIDCGTPKDTNYTDETTGIRYISDADLIDTGVISSISDEYKNNVVRRPLLNVRSFPEGIRNCYILRPVQGKFNKYLIRATFLYGDYDGKNKLPQFDLHLGVGYWDTVKITKASFYEEKEILHIPSTDIINFCLVNNGLGTPFISLLELRPLKNSSIYTTESGSLHLVGRTNLGSPGLEVVRYKDDIYDRIWIPYVDKIHRPISTTLPVNVPPGSLLQPPSIVMSTAVAPLNSSDPLIFSWTAENFADEFYFYVHFAELEALQKNQSREFNIYFNEVLYNVQGPVVPKYLIANSFFTFVPQGNRTLHLLKINKTRNSTLPPIVSGLEVYSVKKLPQSQTDEKDFTAVMSIRSMYRMTKNWHGDPCAPEAFIWVGINCSYDGSNPPRIISMDLSSSGLKGMISPSISNLTMLQNVDLSNNNLTGQVPEFLAELESLKILNLKGNNFTGPIPVKLQQKSRLGLLSLSMDGLDNGTADKCTNCKKKNKIRNGIIPVVASIAISFLLLTLLAILWIRRRRAHKKFIKVDAAASQGKDNELETKIRRFTYSDILNITNNKQIILGKGAFGIVYHGKVDNTEVAVKLFLPSKEQAPLPSRDQGFKELQEEAKVPLNVHHKNLTSLIGYCIDGTNMAIIYEYMANGDLGRHIFDKDLIHVLSWQERLQIATDAAQGLEYLHHGCTPPMVHRDIKCPNILLNDKLEAKLADFGLCKAFPIEGGTHISTFNIAGTLGYIAPEYHETGRLTVKSDVYSFGVVLLEIITGRRAIIPIEPYHITIAQWVTSILEEGDVKDIADPRLLGDFDVNSAWKFVEIAMDCVSRDSTKRPTMNQVVIELKECLAMEMTRLGKKSGNPIEFMSVNVESVPTAR